VSSETPTQCQRCKRAIRPRAAKHPPGAVHGGRGLCTSCYLFCHNAGILAQYPPLRSKVGHNTASSCSSCGVQVRSRHRPDLPGRAHKGRGLCASCHDAATSAGTITTHSPVREWTQTKKPRAKKLGVRAVLHEEIDWFLSFGWSNEKVAAKLGVTDDCIERHILARRELVA
jgi:hypothetical protein